MQNFRDNNSVTTTSEKSKRLRNNIKIYLRKKKRYKDAKWIQLLHYGGPTTGFSFIRDLYFVCVCVCSGSVKDYQFIIIIIIFIFIILLTQRRRNFRLSNETAQFFFYVHGTVHR
jgi:hypothetical protein